MLKKHMAACLVATAFAAAPALAQTPPPPPSGGTDRPVSTGTGSTTTGSPAMQPGAATGSGAAPASGATMSSAPPPAPGGNQFVTQIQPDQVMASKLIGTTVVGANNESIGDVNDVIVDRRGQAIAVVIGVGGFLGIGEKDVAVPFQQLEFSAGQQGNQQASGTTGATMPANNATNSTVNTTGSTASQQDTSTNRSTATTGNTGNPGSGPGAGGGASSGPGGNTSPDRILLRMSKADLQAAPTFSGSGRGGQNQNAGGGSGSATAPKQ